MRATTPLTVLLLSGLAVSLTAADHAVTVDAEQRRQTIEGFGTCLVSWGKTPHSGLYDEEMAKVYVEEMGLNMLRVNVAPWGYPKTEDADAITWEGIDLAHKDNSRVKVFIDFAKKLKALDPDLRPIGTVWSPPAWMKLTNDITGGRPWKGKKKQPGIHGDDYKKKNKESRNRVDKQYYQHFCELMVAMCKLHQEHGVPFYAMSPGNEIMFSQTFESCVWTAKDFATIVGMLGETLEREGFGDVLIFGPETMTKHNWSIANPLYIKELQRNEQAWKHFDRFATHGYVDGFEADMSAESSLEYWQLIEDLDRPYWMTEGGTGDHDWPKPLAGVAAGIHNSLVAGNASAWVPWQIASGNGEKNHHALMAGKTQTKKTQAAKHFTRWIDAGAQRVHVEGETGALRASAFVHDDTGRLTLVVINPSEEAHELTLALDGFDHSEFAQRRTSAEEDHAELESVAVSGGAVSVAMPAQSIVTLVGEAP